MIFKLLILTMSLLIFESSSLYRTEHRGPSPWNSYRYNIIPPESKRDENDNKIPDTDCKDSPNACPDLADQIPKVVKIKPKKAYNELNSMEIWRMLAEHSNIEPVIFVSDIHYPEKLIL